MKTNKIVDSTGNQFKNVFVTVGTTKFESLISTLMKSNILKVLREKGCRKLVVQYGAGEWIGDRVEHDISICGYSFKDSIDDDIADADLVISHAGAGTCLDVLDEGKPLIVVVNEDLMNNHQTELADKLRQLEHLFSCTCVSLDDTIKFSEFNTLKPFTDDNDKKCASFIEHLFSDKKHI